MRRLDQRLSASTPADSQVVGKASAHDSAQRHVSGTAQYIDDMPEFPDQLHVATGYAEHAHARIRHMDLSRVRSAPGVVDVITQQDIPGNPDISPISEGDLLLAGDYIEFHGQPLFAVAATSYEDALRAVRLARIDCEVLPAVLDVEEALAQDLRVLPVHRITRGDPSQVLKRAEHQIDGEIRIGGQEHFYLEGQIGAALKTEEGGLHLFSSSQHPSEVQKVMAHVLDIPINKVQVEVRRMGGGFGGKESQASLTACMAGLFAFRTGRPVRFRMSRRDDMIQTGKRHPFYTRYQACFDEHGCIKAVDMLLAGDCGCTADLSQGIVDRAMFHADNSYFYPAATISGHPCKTNKVSNTAFRGFGGPQGMLSAEAMIEDIARCLGKDPLVVRKNNLYQPGADVTPYGQTIDDHVLPDLIARLEQDCEYWERREEITRFNRSSAWIRKGLALTPVKFGISFTASHLNQAGALVHIYTDGSIHLNHGGTEMGQGLYTKVAQVVAQELGVSLERVGISATRTDKVPNTSPTAASAGSDMNGMAARDACQRIKRGLIDFACTHFGCAPEEIRFADNQVIIAGAAQDFAEFIRLAYLHRVPLSSTGFYSTPKIWYDRDKAQGRPFYYFAHGAACSEVSINTMTGEYRVERVDILHDVGNSLNPAIDIGQIEGGFIQGMGWLTTEELYWNEQGQLLTQGPATYKIPSAFDLPPQFSVSLFDRPNAEDTIHRSKAVGEPPLMLAISVWSALRDACASLSDYKFSPVLDTPATPERVYWAVQEALRWSQGKR